MKIVVFGASGDVGRRVVFEALNKGHDVTAVARNLAKLKALPKEVTVHGMDVRQISKVVDVMASQDLAISALRPNQGHEVDLADLTAALLEAATKTQTRVLVVGGAASLKLPDGSGHTVLSAPNLLPPEVVPIATACQDQYERVRKNRLANWSYLCPPGLLRPGKRTGAYRLGTDTLLVDPDGNSQISMEDFAVALLEEAERPKHIKRRYTVAY